MTPTLKRLISAGLVFIQLLLALLLSACSTQNTMNHDAVMATETPIVWSDKSYLQILLSDTYDESIYTKASYEAYLTAFDKAQDVNCDANAEQDKVDEATALLSAAATALEKRADFSETEKLCKRIEGIDRELFTENSLAYLDSEVKIAYESINADAPQSEANEVYTRLAKAAKCLVAKPLPKDKTKSETLISAAYPVRADGAEFELGSENAKALKKLASSRIGNLGYFILDLGTGANLCFNADGTMFQASTVKAQFCLYVYNLLDAGKASMDDEWEYKKQHHSIGSGEIKNTPYGSTYKLDYLIEKALTISDNCAYHIMLDAYGIDGFNKFIKGFGCKCAGKVKAGYRFGNATPRDIAIIWSEIYTYTVSGKHGQEFRTHLENSAYNAVGEAIKEYPVAHKSGWTSAQFNDFAIVYAPHPYLIVTFVRVSDGGEPDFVEDFSSVANDIMSEYHSFIYENEDFYLPEKAAEET